MSKHFAIDISKWSEISILLIFCYVVLLANANARFSVLGVSVGFLSIMNIIFICAVGCIIEKWEVQKFFHRHIFLIVASFIFLLSFLIKTVIAGTSHAWGIFGEWILLPLSAGLAMSILLGRSEKAQRAFMRAAAILLVVTSLSTLPFLAKGALTYDGRLTGIWPSPNHLALFLGPLISVVVISCKPWSMPHYSRTNTVRMILSICTVMLATFVLVRTESVGSIVAVALTVGAVVATMYVIQKKYKALLCMILLGLALLLPLALGKVNNAYTDLQRNPLTSRMMIWRTSVDLLRGAPITGIEIGTFQERYLNAQKYYTPYLEWAVPLPHNLYLALWLYGGLIGLSVFLAIIIHLVQAWRQKKAGHTHALPFFAGMITILLQGIFDTPLFRPELAVLFWLCVSGLLVHLWANKDT